MKKPALFPATIFLLLASLTAALGLAGCGGEVSRVTGSVTYRERIALNPDCWAMVRLQDVTDADGPERTVAKQEIRPAGRIPIDFVLDFDPALIDPTHSYSVAAEIRGPEDQLLWASDTVAPVLTQEHGAEVHLVLVRVPHTPR